MPDNAQGLAATYLEALESLPDAWRARRALEDELAAELTGGRHVCLRGFWRIGTTTLLRGTLQRACERTGGAAFVLDVRDESTPSGLPASAAAVRARLAEKVTAFLARVGASELKVDAGRPLEVLGELAAPLFVGLDECQALQGLGLEEAGALLDSLLAAPRNVHLVLVCHRHRELDAFFESRVEASPLVTTAFVGPVSDEELAALVQPAAQAAGTAWSDEGLGLLAAMSGNRPFEALTFAALAVQPLQALPEVLGPELLEAWMDLDALASAPEGVALVDNVLRIVVTAMHPEERAVLELLALGTDGEASEEAVQRLERAGLVAAGDEGYAVVGMLLEGIARALAEGVIKVSVGDDTDD